MRLLACVLATGVTLSSCGEPARTGVPSRGQVVVADASVSQDDGGPSQDDGGKAGTAPSPCVCENTGVTATFEVLDSLGHPVDAVTFSQPGRALDASCTRLADGGAPPPDAGPSDAGDAGDASTAIDGCAMWLIWFGYAGATDMTVSISAPGYQSQTISVVPVPDCCGGASINLVVTLRSTAFACGSETCTDGEYCVTPCCGGPQTACFAFPEASVCPPGYHYDVLCSGNVFGCRMDPCTPPPPFCSTDAGACPAGSASTTSGRSVQCNCQ